VVFGFLAGWAIVLLARQHVLKEEDEPGLDSSDSSDGDSDEDDEGAMLLAQTPISAPAESKSAKKVAKSGRGGGSALSQEVSCRMCLATVSVGQATRQGSSQHAAWICFACRNAEDTMKKMAKLRGVKVVRVKGGATSTRICVCFRDGEHEFRSTCWLQCVMFVLGLRYVCVNNVLLLC
jgi:hypothetical protein